MEIKFDYSLDSQGFFNDIARREALEAAGRIWSDLLPDEFGEADYGSMLSPSLNNLTQK